MILNDFPHVLWINMDRSIERQKYMQELLTKYKLQNTRISAIDGTKIKELCNFCKINKKYLLAENGCTCSHLKALSYFVENIKDDTVIIFEDDVSFEFLEFIPFHWNEFMKHLPNYEVIQLAITSKASSVKNSLVRTISGANFYCSTAYLINKTGAKKF